MPSRKKTIFFDFDGVIADTFDACLEVTRMRSPGITAEELQRVYEGNFHDAIREGRLVFQNPHIDFAAEYSSRVFHRPPIAGMPEVIQTLAVRFRLAVVTANQSPVVCGYLQKHGLDSFFDQVVGHTPGKNKSQQMKERLEAHGAASGDALFVTDTLGDLKEAALAGVSAMAVLWGFHSEKILAKGSPAFWAREPRQILEQALKHF